MSSSAFQLTDAANAVVGTAIAGGWTLNGNTFTYRRIITITNSSGSTMPKYYEISLPLSSSDSNHVYTNSQQASPYKDFRIAYDSGTPTEIARNVSSFTSSNVTTTFQLQASIANSGTATYYIYYSNSTLATTPDTYTGTTVLDNGDAAIDWTSGSSDFALSQETTIKHEGTGSLKTVSSLGTMGAFATTSQGQLSTILNSPTSFSTSLGGTNYVYVLGGNNGSADVSTVYKADLNTTTGNISTFTTTSQGQLPQVLSGAASVAAVPSIDGGTGADGTLDLSLGSGAGGCNGTGLSWAGSTCTIDTDTKSTFNFTTINVSAGTTLTTSGTTFPTLKATGSVTIAGAIDLAGKGYAGGLTSGNAGCNGYGPGFGRAFNGNATQGNCAFATSINAGGGGGYGGAGGTGAVGSVAGTTYDTAAVGSGGGGGGNGGNGYGGAGGGGIQIQSGSTISITGTISANGANGITTAAYAGGGGGGSGGRITLQAASAITNSGTISANGGNGGGSDAGGRGGGGGGGGRITIQDSSGAAGGTITATYGTGAIATQGNGANGTAGVITQTANPTLIYLLGGINGSTRQSTVYKSSITGSDLGAFDTTSQAQLLVALSYPTSQTITISNTSYVYVLGGNSASGDVSTVYRSTVTSGNLETFATTNQGQLPQVLSKHSSSTVSISGTNYVYVIGGINGSTAQSTVYKSTVDGSGNLSSFDTTNQGQLPAALYSTSSNIATVGGTSYLYVLGGINSGGSKVSTVYKAQIGATGDIGAFSTTGQNQLPAALGSLSSVTATVGTSQYIYTLGGAGTSASVSTVYKAKINDMSSSYATKTLTSTDLTNKNDLTFWVYSDTTGAYMHFDIYDSTAGWTNCADFTISSASTWEQKSCDISAVAAASKDGITSLRISTDSTVNITSSFTTYFDDIQATPNFASFSNTTSYARAILGAANLAVNAQGTGLVQINYSASPNAAAGSGGFALYDGTTNALFVVDGTGTVTTGIWNGTDIAVTAGGTGASTAADARTNLGLAIGTNVQAYDADLTTYAGITPSANVQTLLGSADYATARTNLGLGTMATQNIAGISAAILPDTNNSYDLGSVTNQWQDAWFAGNLTVAGNLIGASSGTAGYFSRSGTTLSTATAGDNITTTGSVGVGTTSPTSTAKLDVAGNIALSTNGSSIKALDSSTSNTVGGNSFIYSKPVTVNNTSAGTMSQNTTYTLMLTGTDASDVYSNSQADYDDVRISYNGTEIARVVDKFTSSEINIRFAIQANILTSASDANYRIHYGNAGLSAPTAYSGSTVLDQSDAASDWTSSDTAQIVMSDDTTYYVETTGSVKGTGQSSNLQAFATTSQGQLPDTVANNSVTSATIGGTTYVYSLGTNGGSGTNSAVYKAVLDGSNNLGSFSTTNQAQFPQNFSYTAPFTATFSGTTYLYAIGGFSSAATSVVYKATLGATGDIGPFSTTNQAQLPATVYSHKGVVINMGGTNYIYIIGGLGSSAVYKATINSTTGDIGAFDTTSQGQLLATSAGLTATAASIGGTNYIYVIGGGSTGNTVVYKVLVDGSGNLGPFSTTNQAQLPAKQKDHTTQIATIGGTSYIYSMGGISLATSQSVVYKAQIDPATGNVGTFDTTSQAQLPDTLKNASSFVFANGGINYIYTIGGALGGASWSSVVYKAQIGGAIGNGVTITKTISSTDLTGKNMVTYWLRAAETATAANLVLEFSNDGGTNWSTSAAPSLTSADTWQQQYWDISGIANGSKNTTTKLRFRLTGDVNGSFQFDQVRAEGTLFSGTSTSTVGSTNSLTNNLYLNAQGLGVLGINYNSGSSGGFTVFNGGTTALMNVLQNGNVGIGTTAPGQKLDLSSGSSFGINGTAVLSGTVLGTGVVTSSLTTVGALASGSIATGFGNISTANTITTSGTMGTAATTAFTGLTGVFSTSVTSPLIIGSTSANGTLTLEGNNTTGNTATNPNLFFKVGDSAGTTAITILNNGNIGIGTTSPGAKLDIGTGNIKFKGDDANNGGGQNALIAYGSDNFAWTDGWGNLKFGTKTNQTLGLETSGYGDFYLKDNSASRNVIQYCNSSCGTNGGLLRLQPAGGNIGIGSSVGIGTTAPAHTIDVVGDAGLSTGTLWTNTSDSRVKQNIETIPDALGLISRLKPSQYLYTPEYLAKHPEIKDIEHYGFIAQDFQEVFPESITTGADGFLQVNASNVIPYMTKAIQELLAKFENHDTRIKNLEDVIASNSAVQLVSSSASQQSSQSADIADTLNIADSLNLTPPSILLSTTSAQLVDLSVASEATFSGKLTAYEATISDTFKSLGNTFLGNTTIAGDFNIDGTMSITGNSISTLGNLFIQNGPLAGNVDFFNGKVVIDNQGNIKVGGNLEVAGAMVIAANAGEDLVAGEAVYISSDGTVSKSDSTVSEKAQIVGLVASDAIQNSEVRVAISGKLGGFTNLIAGKKYYLGEFGQITTTPPINILRHIQAGIAFSSTEIIIQIFDFNGLIN
ncbi:MAG: tail fiber domain-containing protein [Microgenomates group bacterium]